MNFSMDWPLSREEKKSQLLRLYSHDVMAADNMLASGNQTLEALRAELEAVRSAAGIQKSAKKFPSISKLDALSHPASPPKSADDEVQRLRQAVESAAAVLRALLPEDEADEGMGDEEAKTPPRLRARSEGAFREPSAVAARPALCRTPRESRRPKRKVSFGGEPEQEPAHSPAVMKEEEEEEHGSTIILQTPPAKVRQVDTPVKAQTSVEVPVPEVQVVEEVVEDHQVQPVEQVAMVISYRALALDIADSLFGATAPAQAADEFVLRISFRELALDLAEDLPGIAAASEVIGDASRTVSEAVVAAGAWATRVLAWR